MTRSIRTMIDNINIKTINTSINEYLSSVCVNTYEPEHIRQTSATNP